MKTPLIASCIAVGLSLVTFRSAAEFEVSAGISIQSRSDFYEPLASEGMWVNVGSYGRCWRPAGVTVEWRPYCNGYWEWTDCGWYWVSDEPWSWACYHYGNWVYDSYYGWVWVPGVEWAPAWVYWRTGGDYIGWAPCGPPGVEVAPTTFVFVENGHFHDRIRPDRVIVNNQTIINQTTIIHNNIQREQRTVDGRTRTVVVDNGPRVDAVAKATGHRFNAIPVQKAAETTFRSVPDPVKRSIPTETRRPRNTFQEQPKPNPDFNRETPRFNHGQEMPNPNRPSERDRTVPPAQTIPPNREPTIPQNQNRMVPQEHQPAMPQERERIVPPTTPERTGPPMERQVPAHEVPHNLEPQQPRGFAVPQQPEHPHAPAHVVPPGASPGNPPSGERPPGHEKDRGQDQQ